MRLGPRSNSKWSILWFIILIGVGIYLWYYDSPTTNPSINFREFIAIDSLNVTIAPSYFWNGTSNITRDAITSLEIPIGYLFIRMRGISPQATQVPIFAGCLRKTDELAEKAEHPVPMLCNLEFNPQIPSWYREIYDFIALSRTASCHVTYASNVHIQTKSNNILKNMSIDIYQITSPFETALTSCDKLSKSYSRRTIPFV